MLHLKDISFNPFTVDFNLFPLQKHDKLTRGKR